MAKLLIFEKTSDSTVPESAPSTITGLALNDPWLDETAADLLYLRLDTANDPLTGSLTIRNAADALNSSTSTFQMQASVADGATAVALQFNNTVALTNNTAALLDFQSNGTSKFKFFPSAAGVTSPGGTTGRLQMNSFGLFDDAEFTGPGVLGGFYFTTSGGTLSVLPGSGQFVATTASLIFATPSATAATHSVNLDSTANAFYPLGSTGSTNTTLGDNPGNSATRKWAGLYISDNNSAFFGNNADAGIQYNGTDLLVSSALSGTGVVGFNSATNWNAAGATATPAIGNLPNAATGTFAGWFTVKDNTGTVRYIPSFT